MAGVRGVDRVNDPVGRSRVVARDEWREGVRAIAGRVGGIERQVYREVLGRMYKQCGVTGRWVPA